jgi:hypothetical protein
MLRRELSPASLEQPDNQEAWQDDDRGRGVGVCSRGLRSQAAEERKKKQRRGLVIPTRVRAHLDGGSCSRSCCVHATLLTIQ